jgi:hypothetical protein
VRGYQPELKRLSEAGFGLELSERGDDARNCLRVSVDAGAGQCPRQLGGQQLLERPVASGVGEGEGIPKRLGEPERQRLVGSAELLEA